MAFENEILVPNKGKKMTILVKGSPDNMAVENGILVPNLLNDRI